LGQHFVSIARGSDGNRTLLQGQVTTTEPPPPQSFIGSAAATATSAFAFSRPQTRPQQLEFVQSNACRSAISASIRTKDIAMHGDDCGTRNRTHGRCSITLLGHGAEHLAECFLDEAGDFHDLRWISRAWLEDRDFHRSPSMVELEKEEMVAVALAPCRGDGASGDDENCVIVGTTSGRVAMLASSVKHNQARLVPRRLLQQMQSQSKAPALGSMGLLEGRLLGILDPSSSQIHVLDVQQGGAVFGNWRLTVAGNPPKWIALAAGGNAFWALDGRSSSLWKFKLSVDPRVFPGSSGV